MGVALSGPSEKGITAGKEFEPIISFSSMV